MKVSTRPVAAAGGRADGARPHRLLDIAGIGMLALAIVVVVALASSDAGLFGRTLGRAISLLFGRGGWLVPPLLVAVGVMLLRGRSPSFTHLTLGLSLAMLAVLGGLAAPVHGSYFDLAAVETGGYVGAVVGWAFGLLLGAAKPVGLGALGMIGLILAIDTPVRTLISGATELIRGLRRRRAKPVATRTATTRQLPKAVVQVPERAEPVREPIEETEEPAPKTKARPKFRDTECLQTLSNDVPVPKEGYQLPPLTLLGESPAKPKRSQQEMERNIETLEGTLEQFGIEANVVEVATGPTVTRYEIQLGPGIRVNRIVALADNIAMDLAASQVRVEAPIPGKAAIGVEVPNSTPTMVSLRELVERREFMDHPSRLYVALGQDVSGVAKYADLTKMPHLLIGGATNSGKSIGLATLITSLLVRNTPKDVRLVMIDPKRVELTLFDHVPHLMCPVIKDVKEAPGVLRAVWREMDRRYDLFSEQGVRNIDGWNAKATFQDRMPYIVVVIDELADLMIQAAAEVETSIVRLAQLARAVGIHLVIATQRPSVDVITGTIKANIPSRIAFSVASHIDSRTILDQKGAENLIGRGDMLFLPIDANKAIRVQGCYVSERDIESICRFWREQESPNYVLDPAEEAAVDRTREGGDFGEETDPFWEEAVRWVSDRGQASTSMLQRKFSIGFQRASRLLDMMEERGIVGPRDGPRPREVLVSPLDVDGLFGTAPRYDVGRTIGDGLEEE
jgi:DNA segregation ATPase FtsK/SpoIIIE, S-DNA-T family